MGKLRWRNRLKCDGEIGCFYSSANSPLAQLGDPERDGAHLGLEPALPEAVARRAGLLAHRVGLRGHHLVDACLDERAGHRAQAAVGRRALELPYSVRCGLRFRRILFLVESDSRAGAALFSKRSYTTIRYAIGELYFDFS